MAEIQYKQPIYIQSKTQAKYSIIWLHGLGADGSDFVPIVPELQLKDDVRFVFPHAPIRPVTINNGYEMPAWYDIRGDDLADKEDLDGISASQEYLMKLIEQEQAQGIQFDNIIIAGFSQGGAVALYTLLRLPYKIGGCMALSTYLPFMSNSKEEINQATTETPIFWGHGSQDTVVPESLGNISINHLKELGYNIESHSYPMAHSVCHEEIQDISQWIHQQFYKN